jgi:hypothetical protein
MHDPLNDRKISKRYLILEFVDDFVQVVAQAVPHIVPRLDSLQPDVSPISEILNEAWAVHEITTAFLQQVSGLLMIPS